MKLWIFFAKIWLAAIQVGRNRFLACPYRFLAAKRQAKAEIFPRAIRTTELPSNPSPLTFRNHQIQILQTSSTHATMAANVSQQDTNTHWTWFSHARTHIQHETKGQKRSRDALSYGRRDKCRTTAAAADGACFTSVRSIGT